MAESGVRVQVQRRGDDGALLWVTLSNPATRNALDETMQLELLALLAAVKDDDSVRCVVLQGAGGHFCSGGDINGFEGMTPARGAAYSLRRGEPMQSRFAQLGKPVIAAVEGWCLAGGTELALMCDFIYAASKAKFGVTEIRIGLLPGWGGLTRLPRAVGLRRAREMIYRGEVIDAAEAERTGLVNRLFPTADALYAAAEASALEIARMSAPAMRVAREVTAQSAHVPDEVAMALERGGLIHLVSLPDVHEGVDAFLAKREPRFNKTA